MLGDLHSAWNGADVAYFNASDYELILFTGDLGASGPRDGARIARALSGLQRPALLDEADGVAPVGAVAEEPEQRLDDRVTGGEVLDLLLLDDGAEVRIPAGTCVVQHGNRHSWENRGDDPAVLAWVLLGAPS